jgi:inosine-uridine nucleoside N-ribohydrolase
VSAPDPGGGRGAATRLVIDTDPGNGVPGADIDDGLALALALRSPEVSVEAVTVVAGNVDVERALQCALEVLDAAGAGAVPVHRGAATPLVQDPAAWRRRLDARHDDPRAQALWRDVARTPSARPADDTPAARALVEIVDRSPGEITVLAVGPLTNVATAVLLDPAWPEKVRRLVVMGGAFDVPNLLHELNFAYDPEATHIVLASAAPMLIVPLDVTLRTSMRMADVDRLQRAGTPLAAYLAQTVRPWVAWLGERFHRDGCPLHDPLALAALVDPSVITRRVASVGMELRGTLTRGRVVAWDPGDDELLDAGLDLPATRPVQIAGGVDGSRFMDLLLGRLAT